LTSELEWDLFDSSTTAVIFVETSTKVTDAHGIPKDNQFRNTLEYNSIQGDDPNCLLSDKGQAIISDKLEDILQTFIDNWQCEPDQHHQNPAEWRYQTIKNSTSSILDHTGAPSHVWILCLQYICYLLNHMYNNTIDAVPLTRISGSTVDISPLYAFTSGNTSNTTTSQRRPSLLTPEEALVT
jgi:hypothetical protein